MSLPASDTFTGVDSTALHTYNANWTDPSAAYIIFSNRLYGRGTGWYRCYWSGDVFSGDHKSEAAAVSDFGGDYMGPGTRVQSGANSLYVLLTNSTGIYFGKIIAGSFTQLGSSGSAPVANDIFRLESSGSSHSSYRNGTLDATIGAQTDSTLTGGAAGFGSNGGFPPAFDTWSGDNLGGGGGGGASWAPIFMMVN